MKCNNCGAEVAEGMKFCCDCGSPLPQEKKCVSCGATIALRMKFCPECGAPQSGEAQKPKFNAAAFAMGDKNVIAGDVVGHQETTHVTGNATIIKNEDQSRQVKRCHICGSLVLITEGFDCPECGQFTCGKCYDADQNCCNNCAKTHSKSKENQYEAALKAALTDGKIDLEERRTLNELAAKLGLSSQQASQIERQVKGEDTAGSMTTAEQLELDSARKLFYACEGNLSSLLSTAQKIYSSYPTNEKALSLYLPVLAASGRSDEALKIINGLGADVLSAYITALDIYLTTGNMSETERYLKKSAMLWPESNTLKCYQAYYYLAMYKKYNDFSFLEKASAANAALKNVSGELELSHQIRLMSLLQKEAGEEVPPYDRDFCKENGLYFRIVANQNLSGVYVEGGTTSTSNSTVSSNQQSFSMSFYDNSIEGFCALHIYTKTQDEYNKLKKVLLENPNLIFSEYQDKNDLANNIDNDPEIVFNEEMYGDCGDPESAIRRLTQLENDCGFKFKYKEIFAGKSVSYNFILEKDDESTRPYRGQWYELYDDDEVLDYWAIIDCIEDGDVYLAERNTLSSVKISIINKKTGEEIGSCPVWIETDETDDEVYQKLKDNDYWLKILDIPIADSIEKLYAMEWKEVFYEYLQKCPSGFLNDLSNEDIDVGDLSVDDLEFKVK